MKRVMHTDGVRWYNQKKDLPGEVFFMPALLANGSK